MPQDASSPLFNQSLAKAFAVLEAFGIERRSMNLPEMAVAANITKSAAQRLAHSLEALGYLRKDAGSKRYSLTPRVTELGMRYMVTSPLIETAHPYLLDLNIKLGETVNLSEPDGLDMVFVQSFAGHRQISVQLPVGSRYPLFCSAAGRAYLSGVPKARADALIRQSELRAYTPMTLTDPQEIIAQTDAARIAGYAVTDSEFFRGDINIASPILGLADDAVAAVGVSVPVTRWTLKDAKERIAPLVMEAAQVLSSPASRSAR